MFQIAGHSQQLQSLVSVCESNLRQGDIPLEECFVIGHEPLIDGLTLPDPGDRHVLAAAIKCSAQVIVTENHKDFPADVLDEHDLITLSADDMLANTFDLFPIDCARALRTVRKRYGNPPFTPSEFLLDLTRAGMPKLAAMARASIEYL
ncbi:PIN domain-containing protein [uncultured Tateyamaria sp.]|uniref:PIN domain-containing protein n=1 Tax=uncultured Tateyamaria sp. TaxID=455651 RepID=UPI002605DC52|nr:PIN domain-containing protein [uncultured Tateyamaria sp.]